MIKTHCTSYLIIKEKEHNNCIHRLQKCPSDIEHNKDQVLIVFRIIQADLSLPSLKETEAGHT